MGARGRTLIGSALLTALASCASQAKNPTPPAVTVPPGISDGEDAVVADIMQHHRFHHYGGVLMLVTMSLDALGLTENEQLQVDHIQADLLAKMRPAAQSERDVMVLLADGVAANRIDGPRVDAALARVAAAAAVLHQTSIDDLDRLHALLTPEQRAALIDRLHAHWALWKQANAADGTPLATLTKDLALTSEQLGQAGPALAKAATAAPVPASQVDAQLHAFAEAFRSEHFEARNLAGADAVDRDLAAAGAARLARFCEAVSPVLNFEQRSNLTEILREHVSHDDTQPAVAQ